MSDIINMCHHTPHSCTREQLITATKAAINAVWEIEESQAQPVKIICCEGHLDITIGAEEPSRKLRLKSNQSQLLKVVTIFFGQYNRVWIDGVPRAPHVTEARLELLKEATNPDQREWFMVRQAKKDQQRREHFAAALLH